MLYINDVFISYKRGKINEQWLNEIFLPLFTDYTATANYLSAFICFGKTIPPAANISPLQRPIYNKSKY